MVLDANLLNTQHYKVCIKGKVEQSREWCSALLYTLVLQLLKREAFRLSLTAIVNFTYLHIRILILNV